MELLFQTWLICTLIFTAASESGHSSLVPVVSVSNNGTVRTPPRIPIASLILPNTSSSMTSGATAEARGAEQCLLPARWEGNYFQSGVHQTITINKNTISTKGRCIEFEGEKYVFKNEKDNCFRCVVFHEKHLNVLQYKETFCIPDRKPLRSICSTIAGDYQLYAMFRLDGVPVDCPFKGPMTFSYNKGHGDCRYPLSTVDSCIHPSRVLLNYQACPDIPGTESTVEEILCLATFREGSIRYLLGLVQFHYAASFEERFRCFAYERSKKGGIFSGNYGNFANNSAVSLALGSTTSRDSVSLVSVPAGGGTSAIAIGNMVSPSSPAALPSNINNNNQADILFRVAQSGDAMGCHGITPIEGSRTMIFKKGTVPKSCQFPTFVQVHTTWYTLDQRSLFSFDSSTLRVSNSTDPTGISPTTLSMTATCHQILDNPTLDKVMLVLRSTSECRSGYICTAIYKRDGHIVEMQLGAMARRPDDACHFNYFNQSVLPYVTLVSSTPETRQCPNLGQFTVTGLSRDGRAIKDECSSEGFTTLRVGCNSLDTFQFRAECSSSSSADAITGLFRGEYSCHGFWEEMGVSYLITTPTIRSSTGARRYCFIFRETLEPQQDKLRQSHLRRSNSVKSSSLLGYPPGSADDSSSSSLTLNPEYSEPEFKRILHFSSIADSCRRNVAPGIEGSLAFNVTSHGRCDDIASGGAAIISGTLGRSVKSSIGRLTSYPLSVIIELAARLINIPLSYPIAIGTVFTLNAF